jgi:hypothetical protein
VEDQPPFVIWARRSYRRRKRLVWFRHVATWVIALCVISLSAFDGTTNTTRSSDVGLLLFFVWLVLLVTASSIVFLARTLRNWEQLGPALTISRSLLSFTILLGIAAAMLFFACQWDVHIEACRTVGELGPPGASIATAGAWHVGLARVNTGRPRRGFGPRQVRCPGPAERAGTGCDGERLAHNPEVAGSNPAPATNFRRSRPLSYQEEGLAFQACSKICSSDTVPRSPAARRGRRGTTG